MGTWSWKGVFKIVTAVAVVAVAVAVAVATAGTAVGVIAAGVAIGATAGMTIGGTAAAINAVNNGEDVFEAVADGMLGGSVAGAVVGGTVAALGVTAGSVGGSLGSLSVIGGGTVNTGVGAAVKLGITALGAILFDIDKHGKPNSVIGDGKSEGIYDNNGNLIYRKDIIGRPHYIKGYGYALPHTHGYQWKFIKGAWRIIKKFVLPF